jgi:hypothetical protein
MFYEIISVTWAHLMLWNWSRPMLDLLVWFTEFEMLLHPDKDFHKI